MHLLMLACTEAKKTEMIFAYIGAVLAFGRVFFAFLAWSLWLNGGEVWRPNIILTKAQALSFWHKKKPQNDEKHKENKQIAQGEECRKHKTSRYIEDHPHAQ